mmetsp:Transcript_37984/g.86919  ORF Transcript_37984/g.86919 Transcript_37984/m.86919 type:complete len:83 (-) Transcript_37984:439-687(-)
MAFPRPMLCGVSSCCHLTATSVLQPQARPQLEPCLARANSPLHSALVLALETVQRAMQAGALVGQSSRPAPPPRPPFSGVLG